MPTLVGAGHRVVRYDTRGLASPRPRTSSSRTAPILIAVLDALGIGHAALVGNSRGGQIAFDSAIEFPDRVVAVVGVGRRASAGSRGESTPEEIRTSARPTSAVDAADPFDAAALTDFETPRLA